MMNSMHKFFRAQSDIITKIMQQVDVSVAHGCVHKLGINEASIMD